MEVKLFNQEHLVKMFIKYINDHNKLPLMAGGRQIDRKSLVEQIKDKIREHVKKNGYCEGEIIRVKLINHTDSIDKYDVVVSFIISKVGVKNQYITVKLFDKKYWGESYGLWYRDKWLRR